MGIGNGSCSWSGPSWLGCRWGICHCSWTVVWSGTYAVDAPFTTSSSRIKISSKVSSYEFIDSLWLSCQLLVRNWSGLKFCHVLIGHGRCFCCMRLWIGWLIGFWRACIDSEQTTRIGTHDLISSCHWYEGKPWETLYRGMISTCWVFVNGYLATSRCNRRRISADPSSRRG